LAVESSRERLEMRLPVPEQALKIGRKISSLSLETLGKMSGTTAVSGKVGSIKPYPANVQYMVSS